MFSGGVVRYGLFACISEGNAIAFVQMNKIRPDDAVLIAVKEYKCSARARFGLEVGVGF